MADFGTLVRIADVHKFYSRGSERVDVLKGVNITIPKGDFLALMGPSGSGKTTLLNLMGGLDTPSSGVVEIGGVKINGLSGSALSKWRSQHIGFVFQLYNLLPVLNAERNVELPLLLTKLSKAERRAVRVGGTDGDRVEVISGLQSGERVIAPIPDTLKDGAAVTVKP